MIKSTIFTLCLLFVTGISYSSIDYYAFSNESDEARFKELIGELRCPKCQNTNLAESNAPLAKDLKTKVYNMINEGKADGQIVDFMVDRYGDFVTYKPPFNALTWWLWLGPVAAFVIAIGFAVSWFRKQKSEIPQTSAADNKVQLEALLSQYDQKDD